MKRFLIALALLLPLLGCEDPVKKGRTAGGDGGDDPDTPVIPIPQPESAPAYAYGADISWLTEMEGKGYKFYTADGVQTECTALMKSLGCNSVRYRVWVNPSGGWNNKADVLAKAKRAAALGMSIMIDFHYSDTCRPRQSESSSSVGFNGRYPNGDGPRKPHQGCAGCP